MSRRQPDDPARKGQLPAPPSNAPAGGTGETPPAPLDHRRILERFCGRRDIVLDLYRLFLDMLPNYLGVLREAADLDDMARLNQRAHAFKGGCMTVAADECAWLASRLERAAKNNDKPASHNALKRLEEGASRLRELMQREYGAPDEDPPKTAAPHPSE